jgi:stress response protein SCP2
MAIPPAQNTMAPPYGATAPHVPIQMTSPVAKAPILGPQMTAPIMGKQPMIPPNINIAPHARGAPLQPGAWIPVTEPDVMVGLGWDFTGSEPFDLDASVTAFDSLLNVVDTIYYEHKKGLSGAVIHYGDNTTGVGEGDDEVIQIILHRIPMNVRYLAVTINSFKKNSLIRARSAFIRLYTRTYHIGKYLLTRTKDCIGLLLGVFERSQDPYMWYFRVMADPIKGHKVTLSVGDIKILLGAYSMYNQAQKRCIHPLPGEPLIEFNKWIKLPNRFLYVGLGWNIQQGMNFDLDASIMTFDRMNNLMEIIYHRNMRSFDSSILHYGDNRTGIGEGDDEVLSVDFAKVNPNAFTMVVVINSFKGNSIIDVRDAFIRIYDTQRPIGVHILNKCPDCIGLCMGIFRKDMNGVWSFCAIKEIVRGIVCTESVPDVVSLLPKYPLK